MHKFASHVGILPNWEAVDVIRPPPWQSADTQILQPLNAQSPPMCWVTAAIIAAGNKARLWLGRQGATKPESHTALNKSG